MNSSNNSDAINAVVPLKELDRSKSRLSPILKPSQRAELTKAMLQDVLGALTESGSVDSITVVSADKRAQKVTEQFNAYFLNEGEPRGLNNAIRFAVSEREMEKSALLVVHADLPLLTPLEVRVFLKEANGYPVVIAPSKDESGTNAMLLQPAEVLRPSFGKDSYNRHLSILDQKGIAFSVQSVRGFGFDIDEPKDLLDLTQLNAGENTENFLRSTHLAQILEAS